MIMNVDRRRLGLWIEREVGRCGSVYKLYNSVLALKVVVCTFIFQIIKINIRAPLYVIWMYEMRVYMKLE